jgi:hypothetical protein
MRPIIDALGGTLVVADAGATPDPAPGEFWVVSTDGSDVAVVLVSAIGRGDHVLVWPVTAEVTGGYPTFGHRLGDQLVTLWPELEFGLSLTALDRMVGPGPSTRAMRSVVAAIEDRDPLPVDHAAEPGAGPDWDVLDRLCRQAWQLADLGWPRAVSGEGVFDPQRLRDAGIDGPRLRAVLRIAPGRAADLVVGTSMPSRPELETVASAAAVDPPEDLLRPASGAEVVQLARPSAKHDVQRVAAHLRLSENAARSVILDRALVAARQQPGDAEDAAAARVRDAVDQLMGGR